MSTSIQYDSIIEKCREIFSKKMQDYGASWRILRASSLTDQIYIKAKRIRSIEETGENKVGEGIEDEFRAIINYCVIAIIQLELGVADEPDLLPEDTIARYDKIVADTKQLMEDKNHDYGEAWREMRVSSLTDMILQKLHRVKQIEDNEGKTVISEGIDANYQDMLNYAVFALIRMSEGS